ncbi:amidase [Nocardioidaceae bacterium]|nr:amidase [Nocardioidaceae bacterium]
MTSIDGPVGDRLHDLTALELGAAIAAGDVGAQEVSAHFADRVERLGSELGAVVTPTTEQARARAAEIAQGGSAGRGPLHGVPTAIKDLHATAGVETSFGSPAFAGTVPDHSDEVVLRLERAGLPSLGKTSTPEVGLPCYTEPEGQPPAVTPYDTTRMAGGSSGGAAAAVAAGLVPVALGSDGGGSIRIPASCCGLVGFKPSRGRVTSAPMRGDGSSLAAIGPLARTVRDAAAFLDVIAGPALGDPSWAPAPAVSFLEACEELERRPRRLRIARFATPVVAQTEVHPDCLHAYDDLTQVLEQLGHEVVEIDAPLGADAVATFETVWAVGAASVLTLVPEDRRHLLRPLTRWLAERGQAVSGVEYSQAVSGVRTHAAAAITALDPFDAVLTPTLSQPPLPVGAIRDDADPEADFEAQKRFTPWTSLWNVCGLPAVSLPVHRTDAGLPVGAMLAGRPADDAGLFALAGRVEQAYANDGQVWKDVHPPCW